MIGVEAVLVALDPQQADLGAWLSNKWRGDGDGKLSVGLFFLETLRAGEGIVTQIISRSSPRPIATEPDFGPPDDSDHSSDLSIHARKPTPRPPSPYKQTAEARRESRSSPRRELPGPCSAIPHSALMLPPPQDLPLPPLPLPPLPPPLPPPLEEPSFRDHPCARIEGAEIGRTLRIL